MIFKMCPDCYELYTITNDNSKTDFFFDRCNKFNCTSSGDLVYIDELIAPEISELNKLGLKTSFSCAGHRENIKNISKPYVAFRKGIKLPDISDDGIEFNFEETPHLGVRIYAKDVTYENVYEKTFYFKGFLNKLIEILKNK